MTTVLPFPALLLLTALGLALGIGLRLVLFARAARQSAQTLTRPQWVEAAVGTLTQSVAVGLPLTFIALLLLATRITALSVLVPATLATAALCSFLADYLRLLVRQIFYRPD